MRPFVNGVTVATTAFFTLPPIRVSVAGPTSTMMSQ
jgi:hypothetical protein